MDFNEFLEFIEKCRGSIPESWRDIGDSLSDVGRIVGHLVMHRAVLIMNRPPLWLFLGALLIFGTCQVSKHGRSIRSIQVQSPAVWALQGLVSWIWRRWSLPDNAVAIWNQISERNLISLFPLAAAIATILWRFPFPGQFLAGCFCTSLCHSFSEESWGQHIEHRGSGEIEIGELRKCLGSGQKGQKGQKGQAAMTWLVEDGWRWPKGSLVQPWPNIDDLMEASDSKCRSVCGTAGCRQGLPVPRLLSNIGFVVVRQMIEEVNWDGCAGSGATSSY